MGLITVGTYEKRGGIRKNMLQVILYTGAVYELGNKVGLLTVSQYSTTKPEYCLPLVPLTKFQYGDLQQTLPPNGSQENHQKHSYTIRTKY